MYDGLPPSTDAGTLCAEVPGFMKRPGGQGGGAPEVLAALLELTEAGKGRNAEQGFRSGAWGRPSDTTSGR